MNYRRIGKTGLSVSEVGYGAWGIGKSGWIGASDDESMAEALKIIAVSRRKDPAKLSFCAE